MGSEENDTAQFQDDDELYIDELHVYALDVKKEEKKQEPQFLFQKEIGENYENSEFNIAESLEKLLKAARQARNKPPDNKKDIEKDLEKSIAMVGDIENECLKINEIDPRKIEELKRMKILLQATIKELDMNETKDMVNLFKSKRKVKVGRNHENSELFNDMLDIGRRIHEAA